MAFLDINNMPVNDRGEVWNNGQMVGMMPGGGGGGIGRDEIAAAIMQQQMAPPSFNGGPNESGYKPVSSGFDIARGPDQGAPFRQQLGDQGWSMQGNNIYDPGGNLVSSAG